jgi:hypothetical protein
MVVNHMSPDEIKIAWDNRDNLAEELERNGSMPVRTLYIRLDQGGTLALGLLKNGKGAVLIDWTNACYQISELIRPRFRWNRTFKGKKGSAVCSDSVRKARWAGRSGSKRTGRFARGSLFCQT